MRRLTASRFGLALSCVYPWTSGLEWAETSSYPSRLGKAFHRFCELKGAIAMDALIRTYDLTPALARKLRTMIDLWIDWFEPRRDEPTTVETKMAIHPESGECRVLDAEGERDYSQAPEGWVTGTADVVHTAAQAVTDWKTGDFVEWPESNPQMRLLSLMASKIHYWPAVEARIEVFQESGHMSLPVGNHDHDVLHRTHLELYEVTWAMQEGKGPTPGVHCYMKFCPIRDQCPKAEKRP